MPLETDVSWQVLRRIVHEWAGNAAELTEVKPLHGGCVNTTLALGMADGQRAVLKISPHRVDRRYQDEAYQLNLLRSLGVPAPEVYVCHTGTLDDPFSYLLMQFVEGVDLAEARRRGGAEHFDHLQMHLADLVLTMHEHTAGHWGRVAAEEVETFTRWADFYHDTYDPIWREAIKSPTLPVKARKVLGRVHERLERLVDHDDVPRLVHWDLWASNVLAQPDGHGRWWVSGLLDPHSKFAHAEAELAYLELFGTVTPAFLRAYQQTRKLPPEYARLRRPVYQLYAMLNHLNLFGQAHVAPLMAVVEKVGAMV